MYVVCYDIVSDRLRNQIAKTLEGYGRRIQYSVFECEMSEKRYQELYKRLLALMQGFGASEGNICFYSICKNCVGKKQIIGVPKKPDGYPDDEIIII